MAPISPPSGCPAPGGASDRLLASVYQRGYAGAASSPCRPGMAARMPPSLAGLLDTLIPLLAAGREGRHPSQRPLCRVSARGRSGSSSKGGGDSGNGGGGPRAGGQKGRWRARSQPALPLGSRRPSLPFTFDPCSKKAVIVKNYDDGSSSRPYGHAIVCGLAKEPRKASRAQQSRGAGAALAAAAAAAATGEAAAGGRGQPRCGSRRNSCCSTCGRGEEEGGAAGGAMGPHGSAAAGRRRLGSQGAAGAAGPPWRAAGSIGSQIGREEV